MNNDDDSQTSQPSTEELQPKSPIAPLANPEIVHPKSRSKRLVSVLRFLVVGGGLFIVFVIGLGISFSACFTIKGPPPPECGPVSFASLILMPGASLLFLIPLSKKIK